GGILGKLVARQLVTPVAKGSLSELHDVSLVHQRHRFLPLLDRVLNSHGNETLRSELRHWLDAECGFLADLALELLAQIGRELFRFGRARLPLDSGINVFRILAEDHDIDLLRLLDRSADTLEIANGPDAGVQGEDLPQGDVE